MQPGPNPILIIEDDQAIRDSLFELLTAEGYSVALAEHGQKALDLLNSGELKPCLILLDLSMPIMDGSRFLEEFARTLQFRHVPIFLMTAAGANWIPKSEIPLRIIRKPLDVDYFMSIIEAL